MRWLYDIEDNVADKADISIRTDHSPGETFPIGTTDIKYRICDKSCEGGFKTCPDSQWNCNFCEFSLQVVPPQSDELVIVGEATSDGKISFQKEEVETDALGQKATFFAAQQAAESTADSMDMDVFGVKVPRTVAYVVGGLFALLTLLVIYRNQNLLR